MKRSYASFSISENKRYIHLLLIAFIGFLVYSNTFAVPFHFDDTSGIVENHSIRDFSDFCPPKGQRWVGSLSFALNFKLWGLNVTGYHIVNLIIHILNSFLVYFIVLLTFKTPLLQSSISKNRSQEYPYPLIALLSALIFISHPVQTGAVTYIVQRFASLATFFYLLSLLMYTKARLSQNLVYFLLSFISAILAMKTKEISFTLPFIVVLYEFYFFGKSQFYLNKKRLLFLIPFLLTLIIIPLSILKGSTPLTDVLNELSGLQQETDAIPRVVYLMTQFRVIVTYIRLLFMPVNLNLDYDYTLSSSFFEAQTFLSFLFLLFIFGLAVYLLRRGLKTGNGPCLLISFGIVWFFLTLSVESSLIPIRDIIFEHRLYLPFAGAAISFSTTLFFLLINIKERFMLRINVLWSLFILFLLTIIPLGIASYNRNLVWKDGITLWEDVIKKSPNKARGYNNLGNAFFLKGFTDKSIGYFEIALRLKPNYAEAYNNLGNVYYSKGQIDKAVELFQASININPDYADAHNNLGVVYKEKGQTDKAIEHYNYAMRQKPGLAEVYSNLGVVYGSNGQIDKAIEYFQTSLRVRPDYADAHNNLGAAYKAKGLSGKAAEHYHKALKLKPGFVKVHINLGLLYLEMGEIEKSRKEFETALKLSPDSYHAREFLNLIQNMDKGPSR